MANDKMTKKEVATMLKEALEPFCETQKDLRPTLVKTSSEKLQLFRINANEPWAEIEATQGNHLRVTYYDGAKTYASKTVITMTKHEAEELYKAIDYMTYNYIEDEED